MNMYRNAICSLPFAALADKYHTAGKADAGRKELLKTEAEAHKADM